MPAAARFPALVAALCCAACAVWLGVQAVDARRVHRANDLGLQGRHAEALAVAAKVTRAPAALRADRVDATAAISLGQFAVADRALARAVAAAPNDWTAHRDRAVVLQQLGRLREAAAEMGRAVALNPRMRVPAGFVEGR